MVVDHHFHVGLVEISAALFREIVGDLQVLDSWIGRHRQAFDRGELIQLVIRFCVIRDHAIAERLHVRRSGLRNCQMAELDLSDSAESGVHDELFVLG